MASGDQRHGPPDCSAAQHHVALARRRLDEARQELRRLEGVIRDLDEAVASYRREAVRLRATLNGDVPGASALLNRKVSRLRSYLGMGSPGGPAASGASAPSLAPGPAAGGAAGPPPDGAHNGVEAVPLTDVDEAIDADLPFEKVPRADMVAGIERLESVVRPAVEQGADGEYFSWLDATRSLDYERGDRRVYDAFYGDTAIRLERAGGRYRVVNGRHRLLVARELGLRSIVARIVGRPGEGR
jgi:hypothetical protein